MKANKDEQDSTEEFYVYTTNQKRKGLEPAGDDYIALKSVKYNNFVVNALWDNVYCNRKVPDLWEKWYGWAPPAWSVDSVELDVHVANKHLY